MDLKNKNIVFCLTASFCTFKNTIIQIKELAKVANIIPIMSYSAYNIDSKYGKAKEFTKEIEEITGNKIINNINEAELIGIKDIIDILIIAPCNSNTLAKITIGIIDNPVCMAVKSLLKTDKSIVIGVSTGDGLTTSAENIGKLLNRKNYFFVPFKQDNPITKPNSLMFDPNYIRRTLEDALDKKQIQPVLLGI